MRNAEQVGRRRGVDLRIVSRSFCSAFRVPTSAFYSYLNATIGSRAAARRAGQMPKNKPTAALNTNASRMASGEMSVFQWAIRDSTMAPPDPSTTPIRPPTRHSTSASTRNWNMMLKRVARLAHADLAGALGDGHEHDVHDADAAHEQAHGGDAGEQILERVGGLLQRREDVGLVADLEVVVLAGPDLVLAPQHALDLDHGEVHRLQIDGLDRDGPEPVGADHAVAGRLQG